MRKVLLGDLVEIKGGGTPDRSISDYWGGSIPWASVKDFKSTNLDGTSESITEEGVRKSATNVIRAGAIIVPTRMAVGKAAINTIDLAINQDLKALLPKPIVDVRYLLHALLGNSSALEHQATGATVKGITLDVLRAMPIPLPSIVEQKRIAAILDQADALRCSYRIAIEWRKELEHSIFRQMFGDADTTNAIHLLGNHTIKIGSGATPTGGDASYKANGIPFVRSMNVRDGQFQYEGLAYIDNTQAAKLANVTLQPNDVLLNITGASVARVCLAPHELQGGRVNQHVAIIRTNGTIEANYLQAFLLSSQMKKRLLKIADVGATRQAITKTQLENLRINVPPLELQQKFTACIRRLKNITLTQDKALAKANLLFTSLQHRAFRGELTSRDAERELAKAS